jgi:hypothetical protein
MTKLDTKKVLEEIDRYIREVSEILEKDTELEELHKEILCFCRLIFHKKSDFKEIDVDYPIEITVLRLENDGSQTEIPIKDSKNDRFELGKKILEVLSKARRCYSILKNIEEP